MIISRFSDINLPKATVKDFVIQQQVDEAFGQFEARVCSAARSAAMQVVSIQIPDGACRKRSGSGQSDGIAAGRRLSEMTGAELVALASDGIPLSSVNN